MEAETETEQRWIDAKNKGGDERSATSLERAWTAVCGRVLLSSGKDRAYPRYAQWSRRRALVALLQPLHNVSLALCFRLGVDDLDRVGVTDVLVRMSQAGHDNLVPTGRDGARQDKVESSTFFAGAHVVTLVLAPTMNAAHFVCERVCSQPSSAFLWFELNAQTPFGRIDPVNVGGLAWVPRHLALIVVTAGIVDVQDLSARIVIGSLSQCKRGAHRKEGAKQGEEASHLVGCFVDEHGVAKESVSNEIKLLVE